MRIMYIDFTNYPLSDVYYGGSEKKLGIIINGEKYMLKFQKSTPFGKRNNHISEYIGSHIFDLLGFNTHKTILGTYKGEEVVACKDFVNPDVQFVPLIVLMKYFQLKQIKTFINMNTMI